MTFPVVSDSAVPSTFSHNMTLIDSNGHARRCEHNGDHLVTQVLMRIKVRFMGLRRQYTWPSLSGEPYGVSIGTKIQPLDFVSTDGMPSQQKRLHRGLSKSLLLLTTSAGSALPVVRAAETTRTRIWRTWTRSTFQDSDFERMLTCCTLKI